MLRCFIYLFYTFVVITIVFFIRLSYNDLYIFVISYVFFIFSLYATYITIGRLLRSVIFFISLLRLVYFLISFTYYHACFVRFIMRILCVVIKKTEVTSRFGSRCARHYGFPVRAVARQFSVSIPS